MPKKHPIVLFSIILLSLLACAFFVHITILKAKELPEYDNLIVLSYCTNGFLAAAIYVLLFTFRERLKHQIGFLFMVGSFLKFVFFFILFYPVYNEDGEINKLEFAAFFVPYAISLVIETIFMAKMLKNLK